MVETIAKTITRGYTTTVITPWGRETYQVWLEEKPEGWVAKIVTMPNRMWALPGGREAVKFSGATLKAAETAAVHFIEDECIRTRRRMAPPIDNPLPIESLERTDQPAATKPAPRFPHRLPVRFGTHNPERPAVTENLSETGMFIITDQPAPVGAAVLIDLRFPDGPVILGGEVIWARHRKEPNRSLGFGVRLTDRPRDYITHLQTT